MDCSHHISPPLFKNSELVYSSFEYEAFRLRLNILSVEEWIYKIITSDTLNFKCMVAVNLQAMTPYEE